MKELIFSIITTLAPQYGIDSKLAHAVITVESSYNPKAIGGLGEVGLFQVRPEFSKYSKEQLFDISINIKEGLRILSEAKKKCKHTIDSSFVICFNGGISFGNKIKFPKKFPYYVKVMKEYGNARI